MDVVEQPIRPVMSDGEELRQCTGHAPQWAPGLGVQGAMGVPADDASTGETPDLAVIGGSPCGCGSSQEIPSGDEYQCCGTRTSADESFIYQLARDLGADPERTVSEMYSPPRVTAAASALPHLGILPGFAMDLRTCDEHGIPWNFDLAERRQAARDQFHREKPMAEHQRQEARPCRGESRVGESAGAFGIHVRDVPRAGRRRKILPPRAPIRIRVMA